MEKNSNSKIQKNKKTNTKTRELNNDSAKKKEMENINIKIINNDDKSFDLTIEEKNSIFTNIIGDLENEKVYIKTNYSDNNDKDMPIKKNKKTKKIFTN